MRELREAEQRFRRLRDRPAPGETDAAERAWRVVEAAYAERPAEPGRRRPVLRAAVATAVVAIGLAAVLTPAGAEVGGWIGDRLSSDAPGGRPAFAALPNGNVLAIGDSGAWVVHEDGALQRVGGFSEAGWSPRGLHVIGARGRRLAAVTPTGTVKWTLWRPRAVHRPAWSLGEGFRVAYLEGGALRVAAGDGTGDRLVRRRAAPVTPAWRPDRRHVLTYGRPAGSIETVDVDARRRVWARGTADPVTALAWSRDGERLVALTARELSVFGRGGRRLVTVRVPGGRALALHPSGRRAAVAVERRGGTQVLAVRLAAGGRSRLLDGGPGRVRGMAWSPDGRRLLVGWADADQWVLLGPGRRVRPMPDVSGEFGAGAGFPGVAGWCCPAR